MKLGNSYKGLLDNSTIVNYFLHTRQSDINKYIIEADGIFHYMKLSAISGNHFVFNVLRVSEAKQETFRTIRDKKILLEVTCDKFIEEIDGLSYNFNTNMLNKK